MYIEFQIKDNIQTVNLKTKRNNNSECFFMCDDCSYYSYRYDIYTTKDTIRLHYSYSDFREALCNTSSIRAINEPKTINEPEHIKSILDLLYVYKLEKIILNKGYEYNTENYHLHNIFEWERDYK